MFIKNQSFKDEETLMEVLFDFDLGDASPVIAALQQDVEQDLDQNDAFKTYRASLTDEEDILELDADERNIRLAEKLMMAYASFTVEDKKLYGLSENGERTLLYTVDLY
jgi:hypothetical protein